MWCFCFRPSRGTTSRCCGSVPCWSCWCEDITCITARAPSNTRCWSIPANHWSILAVRRISWASQSWAALIIRNDYWISILEWFLPRPHLLIQSRAAAQNLVPPHICFFVSLGWWCDAASVTLWRWTNQTCLHVDPCDLHSLVTLLFGLTSSALAQCLSKEVELKARCAQSLHQVLVQTISCWSGVFCLRTLRSHSMNAVSSFLSPDVSLLCVQMITVFL